MGERLTIPVPFEQFIDDYIESYYLRSSFSRERMGQQQAEAFDQEVRAHLLKSYPGGSIPFQVAASVVWGIPLG